MKTLKCDMCEHEESAESFQEWMQRLKPHYAEAHADFMKAQEGKSKEEQMADMNKWMEENKARFDAA